MVTQTFTINTDGGLGVRQASKLIAFSNGFKSSIEMTKNEHAVNAKSILSLINLSVMKGDVITICVTGDDEQLALDEIIKFLNEL